MVSYDTAESTSRKKFGLPYFELINKRKGKNMKIATTCPHCGSTEQYDYNSPNQQRSQTCKKCRKSYRVQVKNHQIVRVTK
tara:strand:+ start:65 stop:307 length:243 start_codon:yes stop_codon:yes gene_type:complete